MTPKQPTKDRLSQPLERPVDATIGLVFVLPEDGQAVQIDIRPNTDLAPVGGLPPSQHPALVYLASLSNGSHRTMIGALTLAAVVLTGGQCTYETMPWHAMRYAHMAALRAWLLQNQSAATGNKVLAAVRGTLRAAWQLGLLSTDAYMHAVAVKPIKGEKPDQAAGRALEAGEFKALLAACAADGTAAGPRDAVILGLGIVAGLRREEIAGLAVGCARLGGTK